jgi:hypothetical protein
MRRGLRGLLDHPLLYLHSLCQIAPAPLTGIAVHVKSGDDWIVFNASINCRECCLWGSSDGIERIGALLVLQLVDNAAARDG